MLANGIDVETLRQTLGHHSITVTSRYLHPNATMQAGAAAAMDRFVTVNVTVKPRSTVAATHEIAS